MDPDILTVYIKTEDIYSGIATDCEARFDTLNYKFDRPLPKGKYKKVIGLWKYELGGKIMTEFSALTLRTYSYLTDYNNEDKKGKDTKTCVVKGKIKFRNYKHCLEATQLENKTNQL